MQAASFGLLGGAEPAEPARPTPAADRLRAEAQDRADAEEQANKRSLFSRMTFGVFDDEDAAE
jgi:outer membrane protein assembly factor BamD